MTAVVIVNWNGRRLLGTCLESLAGQTTPPDLILVVDNGSTDDSLAYLRDRWPAVRIVALGHNAGVAAGNNAGVRAALEAGADAVVLLNNDAIMRPGALAALRGTLDAGGAAVWAAAPKILYRAEPGRIWSAGGSFNWWRGISQDRGTGEADRGQYDSPSDIDYANTCCLLVRAEAFGRIGLMDEAYFMYYDDSDFSARVGQAGGRIRYVPSAEVLHDVQGSSGGGSDRPSPFALYYTTRNRARFIARNGPSPVHRLLAHGFTIGTRYLRAAQAAASGRGAEARLVLAALHDGYVRRETGVTRRTLVAASGSKGSS